jgi:hypothetical protein
MSFFDKYGARLYAGFVLLCIFGSVLALSILLSDARDRESAEKTRRRALEERVERIDQRTERIERLLGDGGAL